MFANLGIEMSLCHLSLYRDVCKRPCPAQPALLQWVLCWERRNCEIYNAFSKNKGTSNMTSFNGLGNMITNDQLVLQNNLNLESEVWILAQCELPGLAFRRWESNQVRLPGHVPPQDICNLSHSAQIDRKKQTREYRINELYSCERPKEEDC